MSTMDRAFIKAYADDVPPSDHTTNRQLERPPGRPGTQQMRPTSVAQAPTAPVASQVQRLQRPAQQHVTERPMPAPHSHFTPTGRGREIYEAEAQASAAMERPATKLTSHAPVSGTSRQSAAQVVDNHKPASNLSARQQPMQTAHMSAAQEPTRMPLSAYTQSQSQPKPEQRFRAGLEVDHFVWPTLCAELASNHKLFDSLAEELIDEAARGNKVIAVSSCRRGEGRTTLLLCVARRLAASGVKVCMIDADLQNPQLSRRLGLAAQTGWDAVITGELAVTEILIDSIDDRLSLFPLRPHSQFESGLLPSQFAIMAGILRDHHDLVLVDTGPLLEGNQSGLHLVEETSGLEAVVLVNDVQSTSQEELRQAQRLLSAAQIKCVGIAENFVQQ